LSSTVPRQEDAKDNSKAKAGPAKKDHKTPTIVQKDPLLTTAEVQAPKPEIAHEMVKEDPPRPTKEQITAAQLKKLMEDLEALDDDKIAEAERKGKRGMPFRYRNDDLERDEDFEIERETGKLGFWAEGEESLGPDEDYYADDITSDGHGRLEEQRDLREYARLIAWELPLLNRKRHPVEHRRARAANNS
jgi:small subunit ribosomal protein S35